MEKFKDVQSENPINTYSLDRVGLTNVARPIKVHRNKTVTLIPTFRVFVDLPPSRKGSDLSRDIEALEDVVGQEVDGKIKGIEYVAELIVDRLLERHPYATSAEAQLVADYFLERKNPKGRKTTERYQIQGIARKKDGEKTIRYIGATATGISVCPSAMKTVSTLTGRMSDEPPFISHNQRNDVTIIMSVPDGKDVEVDTLIDIAEASMSAPTFELLKREEEGMLVLQAHKNPKFVEDVVRDVVKLIVKKFEDFPDTVMIEVRSESYETIHKHNAYAEKKGTLGDFRKELKEN
ncbi:MAG: GTP cyclohydrolase MptA [Candidatus Thermoplasmatota archaeon]|jgi:GTP cyclohydrolase-4|nr:GTP cyclohydrolase MptA [Candidatus Thermoplasmatota archaeon]MCL5680744.1 GTP cyclohydrolase MptA [Candidatus Thermoplasmatota archaeon]